MTFEQYSIDWFVWDRCSYVKWRPAGLLSFRMNDLTPFRSLDLVAQRDREPDLIYLDVSACDDVSLRDDV